MTRTILLLLMTSVVLSGCAWNPGKNYPGPFVRKPGERVNLQDQERIKHALYAQWREWNGVKYKLGGLSRKGIDCSGFVKVFYRDKLGIDVPNVTTRQAQVGNFKSVEQVKPGDLIFFKTSKTTWHVGIYIEKRMFLHASTSRGVVISYLDDKFWRRTYWNTMTLDPARATAMVEAMRRQRDLRRLRRRERRSTEYRSSYNREAIRPNYNSSTY